MRKEIKIMDSVEVMARKFMEKYQNDAEVCIEELEKVRCMLFSQGMMKAVAKVEETMNFIEKKYL